MSKALTRIQPGKPHPAKALRRQALALVGARAEPLPAPLGPEATQRLLHELHMHQMELELQNVELRRAQEELEVSQKRYVDLYDYAPVGYLTLSKFGLILDANLTAGMLLGVSRRELHRQPLARFVLPADQDAYYFHRTRRFQSGAPAGCELRLLRKGSTPFWARLEASVSREDAGDPTVYRVIISDITERKFLEGRSPAADELACGNAAHELGTVLEAILSAACSLKAAAVPASATWMKLDAIATACTKGRGALKGLPA
jgi:PAS domain S-box-containing protein